MFDDVYIPFAGKMGSENQQQCTNNSHISSTIANNKKKIKNKNDRQFVYIVLNNFFFINIKRIRQKQQI